MSDGAGRPPGALAAIALLAVALLGLALHDAVLLPACVAAIALSRAHRFTLTPPAHATRWRFAVLGAGALVASWLYYQTVLGFGAGLGPAERAIRLGPHLLAVTGIAASLALVWLWHTPLPRRVATPLVLALAAPPVVASGSYYTLGPVWNLGLVAFLAACLLAPAWIASERLPARARLARLAGLGARGVVVFAVTLAVGRGLKAAERLLGVPLDALGLPGYVGLGSGNGMQVARERTIDPSDRLLAAMDGEASPGYLRAQVLWEYSNGHWKSSGAERTPLAPGADGLIDLVPAAGAAPAAARDAASERTVTLFADLRGVVPLSYGARRVRLAVERCFLLTGDVLECTPPAAGIERYGILTAAAPEESATASAPASAAAVDVSRAPGAPEGVLAALRPLALEVAAEARADPLASARRIERHFHERYVYSKTVRLAREGDPVVDFVLNRKPAYCEHFASGMVLLLRALGHPARVAGGFLVEEWNDVAQAWVVRESDAHAWVEVLDPARGRWVRFDPTPPGRDSEPSRASAIAAGLRQLRDALHLAARALGRAWSARDPFAAAASALSAISALLRRRPWLVAGLVLAPLAYALNRRLGRAAWRRAGGPRAGPAAPDATREETRAALRASFARVARALERRGTRIAASETLDELLGRTSPPAEVGRYLAAYRRARFAPGSPEPEADGLGALERAALARLARRE